MMTQTQLQVEDTHRLLFRFLAVLRTNSSASFFDANCLYFELTFLWKTESKMLAIGCLPGREKSVYGERRLLLVGHRGWVGITVPEMSCPTTLSRALFHG